MKNKLFILPLLLISLFFGISIVKADETYYFSSFYNHYEDIATSSITYSEEINTLVSYYNSNLSNTYNDYYIKFHYTGSTLVDIRLVATNFLSFWQPTSSQTPYSSTPLSGTDYDFVCYYNISSDSFTYNNSNHREAMDGILYYSSSPITFTTSRPANAGSGSVYDTLQLPSYSNIDLDVAYPLTSLSNGDIIPTYMSLTNGEPTADFTTVDMSQYDYIILSLRDYNTTSFNTTIYSLGRLCFTPVYNYGMTQKQDYIQGYQTMGCSENYSTSTPVMIFIIQADLDNHAVYYIKRYSNETNILKIPTSIFNISYITSANANNPTVSIDGRTYPTIPYSDLTDTANISSDEGYISGQVCALGDVNCEYETGIGLDISDIFTQPLTVLENVWASITSVFLLITKFIMLIPSPLREFLISSFMLAVVLGLIKIIL